MTKTITMTAYGRPEFLKQALDALAQCVGIGEYKLIVSLDPYDDESIRDSSCSLLKGVGFCEIDVLHNSTRMGLNRNTLQVLDAGFSGSDYVVHIESDVLLGPDALRYFEYCGKKYDKDKTILSVTSINNRRCEANGDFLKIGVRQWFSCWGWATWADRWSEKIRVGWSDDYKSWAPCVNRKIRGERYEVYPILSRSINIGTYGENTRESTFRKKCLIRSWSGDARWTKDAKDRSGEWGTLS